MTTHEDFLAASRSAAALLRDPAVAAAWHEPSALPEFGVAGLAGHLAYQVIAVPRVLGAPVPAEPVITLAEHYARVGWIEAGLDDEINVAIRNGGDEEAADGPEALAGRLDAAIAGLAQTLPAAGNRPVRLPFWGSWSLGLEDLLISRMMELAVHSDDLAVSVGVETPEFPVSAMKSVLALLTDLATTRHGATAVLRALSRRERAPGSIAAF